MDPITRFAPASPFARRIGRTRAASACEPAPEPVAPLSEVVALRTPTPGVYLASPALLVAAVPEPRAADDGRDALAEQLALARQEQARALRAKDAEIAALRAAASEVQEHMAEARAEAEARGFAEGKVKGEKAGQQALQAHVERAGKIAEQVASARAALDGQWEEAMVGTVFAAVCRILGQCGAEPATVAVMVREAAAATRSRDQITVRLHPEDAALFQDRVQLVEGGPRFLADPSIALGGCLVDSATGTLDARFETQLALLAAGLAAVRARRLAEPDAP